MSTSDYNANTTKTVKTMKELISSYKEDYNRWIQQTSKLSEHELQDRYAQGGSIETGPELGEQFIEKILDDSLLVEFPEDALPKGSRIKKVRDKDFSLIGYGEEGTLVGILARYEPHERKRVLLEELGYGAEELLKDYPLIYSYVVQFDCNQKNDQKVYTVITDIKIELC